MSDTGNVIKMLETMLSNYDALDEIEINKGNQMLLMHRAIAQSALELLKKYKADEESNPVVVCPHCGKRVK